MKYASEIHKQASMIDSKPVATHMSTIDVLSSICTAFLDPTCYGYLVGALQYLTIT